MGALLNIQSLVALVVLTILEVVLGVDNIIFLAIVTANLPRERQASARRIGLTLALVGRIGERRGTRWFLA